MEDVKYSIEIEIRMDVERIFIKEDYFITVIIRVLLKDQKGLNVKI